MKKAMIVQPMNGLGEEQILEARAKAVAELERRGYEVVDTYFKDGLAVPPKVVNVPLYYLSQSLGKMAECDAVYLCDGWENARGCKVERAAAVAYYEPGSGWNLPPGCFDGDPNAPWNQVDEPACGDCAHCIEGCCDYGICELEFEEAFSAQEAKEPMAAWEAAKWARGWIVEHYKDMQEDWCKRFDG